MAVELIFFRQTVKTYFIIGKFCQYKLKLCCWKMEDIHVKLIFILVFISSSAQIEVKVSYKLEILNFYVERNSPFLIKTVLKRNFVVLN